MQSITYSNTSQWEYNLVEIEWTFDDGGTDNYGISFPAESKADTITTDVQIAPVQQPPAITTNTVLTVGLGNTGIISAGVLESTDPDSLTTDLVYRLTQNPDPAKGKLFLNSTELNVNAGVTAFTQTQINNGELSYVATATTSSTLAVIPDSFSFAVRDETGTEVTGTGNIEIHQDTSLIPANIPPQGIDGSILTIEDTSYNFKLTDFSFTDPDNDTLLAVVISSLPQNGTLELNGSTVTAGQQIDAADIQNMLFIPQADLAGPASTTFEFRVQDNGGTFNAGIDIDPVAKTLTVDITPVNDAPLGKDNIITVEEDTPHSFSSADFGFSDVADGNSLQSVIIKTLPVNGQLTLTGVPVSTEQSIPAASIPDLQFTPKPDEFRNGYDTFSFMVVDDGGTSNGGFDTDQTPNNININVTGVNDAPTGTDKTITLSEDTVYFFNSVDFGFSCLLYTSPSPRDRG